MIVVVMVVDGDGTALHGVAEQFEAERGFLSVGLARRDAGVALRGALGVEGIGERGGGQREGELLRQTRQSRVTQND